MRVKVKVHVEDIEQNITIKQSITITELMSHINFNFSNMVIAINGKRATKASSLISSGDVVEIVVPAKAVEVEK